MAGPNVDPIYSKAGLIGAVAVTAANTSSQGGGTVGTDIFLAFTADATNGSFVRNLQWSLNESTIATASTGTVGRVFISTVGAGATATSNTHLIAEVALTSQTPSSTLAMTPINVPLNFILPAGYFILVTNHTSPAANTAWKAIVFGGQY